VPPLMTVLRKSSSWSQQRCRRQNQCRQSKFLQHILPPFSPLSDHPDAVPRH
jgi:hypothetical protein